MGNKKGNSFQKSLKTINEVVEAKLAGMSAAEADAKRAEIHRIASTAGRAARGKPSKRARTRVSRRALRVHA